MLHQTRQCSICWWYVLTGSHRIIPSSTDFNYLSPLEDTCPSITRSSIATSENLFTSKLQWHWLGSFRPCSGRRGYSYGSWLSVGERCRKMIVIFNLFMTVSSWRSWLHWVSLIISLLRTNNSSTKPPFTCPLWQCVCCTHKCTFQLTSVESE